LNDLPFSTATPATEGAAVNAFRFDYPITILVSMRFSNTISSSSVPDTAANEAIRIASIDACKIDMMLEKDE